MKKAICMILALMLCLGLCACGEDENKTAANIHPDYVGEWKGIVRTSSGSDYDVFTIILNQNGSAVQKSSTREAKGTWRYSEDDNRIVMESDSGDTFKLTPMEENSHTVLSWGDTAYYYRVDEIEIIDVTADNWQDYFEVKLTATMQMNDAEEIESGYARHCIYLKEEYLETVVQSRVSFQCVLHDCYRVAYTHDLETGEVTFEKLEPAQTFSAEYWDAPVFNYSPEYKNVYSEICGYEETYKDMFVLEGTTATWEGTLWTDVAITKPTTGYLLIFSAE